jgi:hypothetical protein
VTNAQAAARWVEALREALGAENVLTGWARRRIAGGAGRRPCCRAEADVSRTWLHIQNGLGVVPWGGGAHRSLGRTPSRYDVAWICAG